jgi:dUTP pyrophosphatase
MTESNVTSITSTDLIKVPKLFDMFKPRFVVKDPMFLPQPQHPTDAGADLRAFIEDGVLSVKKKLEATYVSDLYGMTAEIYSCYVDGKEYSLEDASKTLREAKRDFYRIEPGETKLVSAGFRIQLPDLGEQNLYVPVYSIRPRSGLALKSKLTVLNTPGTIDCNYRDWVGIILYNSSQQPHFITHGSRIAQGVYGLAIRQRWSAEELIVDESEFNTTDRSGGFGSTGV